MIGEKIRFIRKNAGLSQSRLAENLNEKYNLNIERSMISKWETGMQMPTMYFVKCIADYFDVSIDYLTGTEKEPPATGGKANELVSIINRLNDENLDRVLDYSRILLQSQ